MGMKPLAWLLKMHSRENMRELAVFTWEVYKQPLVERWKWSSTHVVYVAFQGSLFGGDWISNGSWSGSGSIFPKRQDLHLGCCLRFEGSTWVKKRGTPNLALTNITLNGLHGKMSKTIIPAKAFFVCVCGGGLGLLGGAKIWLVVAASMEKRWICNKVYGESRFKVACAPSTMKEPE